MSEALGPYADADELRAPGYPLTGGLHKVARADHFEPDGFYRTGDLGLVDGDRIHSSATTAT